MVNLFDLKDVTITNPIFNPTKIDWFNGQYIRKTTSEELFELLKPFLQDDAEIEMVRKIIPLVQDRLVKLSDWKDLTDFFFIGPEHYNEQLLLQAHKKSEVKDVLEKGINLLGKLKYPWNHDEWEKRIRNLADEYKWKHADVFQIFRVALTGRTATPPLFEMMMVLGAKEVETRLKKALGFL
jgi:glutamyl/glutaminyl-tRNA synthetase